MYTYVCIVMLTHVFHIHVCACTYIHACMHGYTWKEREENMDPS